METLYYVISELSGWVQPTISEIKLGQRSGGTPATAYGNEVSNTVNGIQVFSAPATGLVAGTNYKLSIVWSDGISDSNVVNSDFYTLAIILLQQAVAQDDNNLISSIDISNNIVSNTIQDDNVLNSTSTVLIAVSVNLEQESDYALVYSQFKSLGLGLLMAGTKNIIVEKGTTYNTIFTWSTKDAQGVKTPVDISTWTARAQMREDYDSTTPVVSLTSSPAAGITLGGAAGTIEIKIPAATTTTIPIDSGVWDLELEDSFGNVVRLLEGKVTFKPEVTR
jgi:hypothetical protein